MQIINTFGLKFDDIANADEAHRMPTRIVIAYVTIFIMPAFEAFSSMPQKDCGHPLEKISDSKPDSDLSSWRRPFSSRTVI